MDRIKKTIRRLNERAMGRVATSHPIGESSPSRPSCNHICVNCDLKDLCRDMKLNQSSQELVYFSKKASQEASRVPSNSLVGRGISFLSCDEKDIYVNPCHLNLLLNKNHTPSLTSIAPVCINFAADGSPRLEGMPWEGLSGEVGSGAPTPTPYDPADPSTYIAFGQVFTNDIKAYRDVNDTIYGVLGFRLKCRVFDTELGASTVGIRVYAGGYDSQVLNALLSVDNSDAEFVIPYFIENVTQSTNGTSATTRPDDQTLSFSALNEIRDGSFNLTMGHALYDDTETFDRIPSFFTLTGQNVYVYVTPILATDKNVSALIDVLRRDPAAYLSTLQSVCV